jgi:hypothetical protein
MGRRRANATYFESHGVDETLGMSYGMDMTPLMYDPNLTPVDFVLDLIQRFEREVKGRLNRLSE